MRHVIFISSAKLPSSVETNFKTANGVKITEIPLPPIEDPDTVHRSIIIHFNRIADAIEHTCSGNPHELRKTLLIVDLRDESISTIAEINPISLTIDAWSVIVAMLILAFPETLCCFNTKLKTVDTFYFSEAHAWSPINFLESLQAKLRLIDTGFTSLFDPTGLRTIIRDQIRTQVEDKKPVAPYVPVRRKLAAVIDEEEEYAFLNAYAAYKFGFRVYKLTSFELMNGVLSQIPEASLPDSVVESNLSLSFEDLYLSFPDRDPHIAQRLSRLPQRDRVFTPLRQVRHRIFMTVGHQTRFEDKITWEINRDYLKALLGAGHDVKMIFKPGAGIFDIWRRSGLKWKLQNGKASNFDWPPEHGSTNVDLGGHSAPGRLLTIAERLLKRARVVLQGCTSVEDALHGALLAGEAQEYLGHRTPTTALEALAIRQQFEVVAECMFYGVEYNMDIQSRFNEIEVEVSAIGRWFRRATRKSSVLNAEIRILSGLLQYFRNHSQFDEEQKSLNRLRALHRRLWFNRHKSWAWIFYPIRYYIEFLLGSVLRFAAALLGWIIVFTFAYGIILTSHPDSSSLLKLGLLHGLFDSITAFFGLQPPHDLNQLVEEYPNHPESIIVLTIFAIITGFVHLGVFISHLYSMISRR